MENLSMSLLHMLLPSPKRGISNCSPQYLVTDDNSLLSPAKTTEADPCLSLNRNITDEQKSNYGSTTHTDIGSHTETQAEQVKDQVDGATPSGPKRATPESGGRVQVGETGDLHDLAARRQP
ncbi:hypothetical protein RRF57_007444 [Xylaria bambusicola]|uniref:Uncharacterized protein n=1 Tax=Xylaria bambusicola TaxID=326684 RepID=A0AAN7YZT5_9PEZI